MGMDVSRDTDDLDLGYWLQCLRLADPQQRAQAATVLGLLGDQAQAAVPALVEAIKDEEVQVRRIIVAALGEIGIAARSAVPALVASLRNRHDIVRRRAAQCLAELGPAARSAVPALIEVMSDPSLMVRRWAVFALGEIGMKAILAVPVLVERLRDADPISRILIGVSLCKIGPAIVPELLPVLKDDNPQVRRRAVLLLGKCGGDLAIRLGALEAACRDADAEVSQTARGAVERLRVSAADNRAEQVATSPAERQSSQSPD